MADSLTSCTTLHNGVKMPWFGLGVFLVKEGDEVINTVKSALDAGYRSIDTAAGYNNEEGVGRAIAESGVPRDEIFVTSKLANDDQGYDAALKAFDTSMKKLGLETLDLYLIHWPCPSKGLYKETWKAFEKLYSDGRIRAIGVSNFTEKHLDDLMSDCEVRPMVNQVELHPRLVQKSLHEYCRKHNIQIEAWSPLMKAQILDDPVLKEIAAKHKKTPAQVVLQWDLQKEIVTIPKSIKPKRIRENADVFDFTLSDEEIARIDSLDRGERTGPDPDTFG